MKFFFFFLSLLLITSCNPVARILYNIKNPDFESFQKQTSFLKKNKIKDLDFYYYKDINSYLNASKNSYLSIPEAYFYNKDGELIRYKKSSENCNAKVYDFIKDLKNFNNLEPEKDKNMNEFLNYVESKTLKSLKKSDVYVFLNWAVFAGKTNKEKTFEWIKLLDEAKEEGVNVSYYLVNCDLQSSWDLTENQKNMIKKKIKNR